MSRVERPVVVVTGASAGVGRATAQAFARSRAKVALLPRGNDGLAAASDEVEAAGSSAVVIEADVADYDQVEAAAERTENELGSTGEHGANGRFDAESRSRSLQWMAVKHRPALVPAGGALLAALLRR